MSSVLEWLLEEPVDMPLAPEQLPEEPVGGPRVPPPRRPTKALPAPGPEVIINDDDLEGVPPRAAAKEHIRVGSFDEEASSWSSMS